MAPENTHHQQTHSKHSTIDVFPRPPDRPYRSRGWLYWRYHILGESMQQIADRCDVSKDTIKQWLDKHDISTRDRGCNGGRPGVGFDPGWPTSDDSDRGHNRWKVVDVDTDGNEYHRSVFVHQLAAILAGYEPEEVFAADTVVHHIDPEGKGRPGRKWLNVPDWLEVMDRAEHTRHHMSNDAND